MRRSSRNSDAGSQLADVDGRVPPALAGVFGGLAGFLGRGPEQVAGFPEIGSGRPGRDS